MASDASDESESDSNDDGLQSLLQMHSPRVAEPSLHMRSPTAAAQFAKPAVAVEGEAPESGWDAAATPRRRAARASCDASSSRTEPSPLPDPAEASGGQLEDWSDLWDVHSKVYAPSTPQTANPILIRPLLCSPGCLTQAQGQAKPERAPDLAARVLHQRTRSPAK